MDDKQSAILFVALYSGPQNYEIIWMYQVEIRVLWLNGVRILLKPAYTGN
ncbi:MAG: hypothetical protein WCF90_11170 [Methanomicrobiales archaeon]